MSSSYMYKCFIRLLSIQQPHLVELGQPPQHGLLEGRALVPRILIHFPAHHLVEVLGQALVHQENRQYRERRHHAVQRSVLQHRLQLVHSRRFSATSHRCHRIAECLQVLRQQILLVLDEHVIGEARVEEVLKVDGRRGVEAQLEVDLSGKFWEKFFYTDPSCSCH